MMNSDKKALLVSAAIAAVAIGAFVFEGLKADIVVDLGGGKKADLIEDDSTAALTSSLSEAQKALTKLGVFSDGGVTPYVLGLNGKKVTLDKFPCVRRRKGSTANACPRKTATSPVLGEDFGELNRFPASMTGAVTPDCEPVACSVWAGDESL